MLMILLITLATVVLTGAQPAPPSPRAVLIELRDQAFDANYRNDAAGLEAAIATLTTLRDKADVAPFVEYYLSWSFWALSAAQLQGNNVPGALKSAQMAAEHGRAAAKLRPDDADTHTALANALIVVAILDRPNFMVAARELGEVRKKALALGPRNPRTVFMDAGMIFNSPPERGGSQEKGLQRVLEALELYEAEAKQPPADPLHPRWGHALTYGWLAQMYLRTAPPQTEAARIAAEAALRMRPDFWYVREQILPKLR
jgi:hypothetical protein